MATNKQLKFFKGANAPAAPAAGMIWFCTSDRTIRVYTGTEWEKYSGLVNAEWVAADKKLNITSANGTVTTLDLSDCASASDISSKLTTINNTLSSHDGRITTAQSAAEAAQAAAEAADAKASQEITDRQGEITRVEGLISAEATTARAAEKANADAAKAADDKAAAAQTYAEGVNTALGQEVTRATEKENELAGKISALETAIGTGGSVDEAITTKIEALDADVTSAEGTQVRVQVVETDGKITAVNVTESATFATAQALSDEVADREADEQALGSRIDALDAAGDAEGNGKGRVTVLEEKVNALTQATHFEGVVEFDPSAEGATTDGYDAGDFVIYGSKEYIFDGTKWVELGDTTDEQSRLSALEGLVGTTSVDAQIDAKIAALSDEAKSSEDANLVKVTVSQADGNVTGVSLDDSKLDQAISDINGRISANTAAHEANAAAIKTINETTVPGINSRLDGIDEALESLATSDVVSGINTRLETAEGEIDTLQAAIDRLDGEQDTQDQAIAAADAKGAQGISDAAAALAKAEEKVASVTAGDHISVGNDAKNPVVSVNVTGQIAEGNTGLVNGGAIFNELCWVEFE